MGVIASRYVAWLRSPRTLASGATETARAGAATSKSADGQSLIVDVIRRRRMDIGLNADLSGSAPERSDWVVIGPLNFTATAKGGVMIGLFAPWSGGESGCRFDSLAVT